LGRGLPCPKRRQKDVRGKKKEGESKYHKKWLARKRHLPSDRDIKWRCKGAQGIVSKTGVDKIKKLQNRSIRTFGSWKKRNTEILGVCGTLRKMDLVTGVRQKKKI